MTAAPLPRLSDGEIDLDHIAGLRPRRSTETDNLRGRSGFDGGWAA